MNTPSPLENDIVNIASLVEQGVAALAAANNPSYSGVISSGQALVSTVQSTLGVPSVASTLPADLVTNVAPTVAAINTIASKTATAAQKAAAVATALGAIETVGEDVWSFFSTLFTKKPSPSATPPAAT
jgi:hypothetical protein